MLNSGDKLQGMVGQSMGGPKLFSVECTTVSLSGVTTFVAPRTGRYKFVAWGAGANGNPSGSLNGGGSGAYGEVTKVLAANQSVSVSLGAAGQGTAVPAGDSVLTFPDGSVCTAGGAVSVNSGGAAGQPSGPWDFSLAGNPMSAGGANGAAGQGTGGGTGGALSTTNGGGCGAPGRLPYRGGNGAGGGASGAFATGPGAGGGGGATGGSAQATMGQVIIQYLGA